MTRPKTFTIAAVLMLLFSLISIVIETPNLMLGLAAETQYNGDGPPFIFSLFNVVTGAMGLVTAVGVWRMQKWAVILTVVLAAFNILTSLPAILFAPTFGLKIGGIVAVVWASAIIALLLWPQPKSSPLTSEAR